MTASSSKNMPDMDLENYISHLDDNQKNAIQMGLDEGKKHIIIEGPPGTGKSAVLADLICQSVIRKKKVFVITVSRSALKNLIENTNKALMLHDINMKSESQLPVVLTEYNSYKSTEAYKLYKATEEMKKKLEKGGTTVDRCLNKSCIDELIPMKYRVDSALVCIAMSGSTLFQQAKFHGFDAQTILVDDANLLLESEFRNNMLPENRIIVTGDGKKLSPVSDHGNEELGNNIKVTVMDMMNNLDCMIINLKMQYRMHFKIMEHSSELFYNGQLRAHPSCNLTVADLLDHSDLPEMRGFENLLMPLVFCDTTKEYDIYNTGDTYCFEKLVDLNAGSGMEPRWSLSNPGEAKLVVKYLLKLLHFYMDLRTVFVMTPYQGQVLEIQKALDMSKETQRLEIKVGNIDTFQGQENEIVVVSLVRHNPRQIIGLLDNNEKLNTMLTRARRQLFLIGNANTFLFNNQGKLSHFANLLKSTNAVVSRSLLKTKNHRWYRVQEWFGVNFRVYLNFNKEDDKTKDWAQTVLANGGEWQCEHADEDYE